MYNEKSFKNQIFWVKVRRIFFMLIFSIIGSALGVIISSYLIDILLFEQNYRVIIVASSTLLFFAISLLVTANTGKSVQDGYWKIEVIHTLNTISEKLDNLEHLDNINSYIGKDSNIVQKSENLLEEIPVKNKKTLQTNSQIIKNKKTLRKPTKIINTKYITRINNL